MRWLVEGCLDWRADGLKIPDSIRNATQNYRDAMNPLTEFIEDRCLLSEDAHVDNPDIWRAYQNWATEGHRKPLGRKTFSQRLGDVPGVDQAQPGGVRVWLGIGLLSESV